MSIVRLNHAVLFVRDADIAAEFYRTAFGFEELERPQGMRAVFRQFVVPETVSQVRRFGGRQPVQVGVEHSSQYSGFRAVAHPAFPGRIRGV